MELLSISGILSWVELQSQNVETVRNVSNILIALYSMSYIFNRKGCFIAAFLLCEVFGNTYSYTSGGGYEIYLGYAFIYCLLYWYTFTTKAKLKIVIACGTMGLFEIGACVDAYLYPSDETLIYKSYVVVVVLLHLYIICQSVHWSLVRKDMGRFIRAWLTVIRVSDAASFFWYNFRN